jgi:hypothetical protein
LVFLFDFDTILTDSKLSKATITALVDTVLQTSSNAASDDRSKEVLKWFCTILTDCIGPDPANKINKAHTLFMKKLLMFWTGVSSYNSWFPYSVTFHGGDIIRSSTCGKQLILPNGVPSKDKLLEALKAVIEDSDGFNAA